MGYFLDSARALGVTLRNAFRKPTTVEFPAVKRDRAVRHRASFALLHDEHGEELCIGCLACERICPSDIITVEPGPKVESPATGKKRGTVKNLTLDLNACIYCELCVQVCPTDAIVMVREPERPGYSREELFLSMERLYENEQHMTASWATGTKLVDMQDPKRSAATPEKPAALEKPEAAETAAPEGVQAKEGA
jgi:NADH-quinone oxidoreductase subunit I